MDFWPSSIVKKVIFLSFVILFLISCSPNRSKDSFTVITWNAYLFFDSRNDGWEYEGFRISDGYTDAIYQERIKRTAIMMAKYFSSADLIILQEIENKGVLEDLLNAGLKKKGYRYYGCAQNEVQPLSVGYISRYRPESIAFHGVDSARKQLELTFSINGEHINILALHAQSRLKSTNEAIRYEEFSLAESIMASLSDECSILIGDFNADVRLVESGIANIKKCNDITTPIICTGDPGECRKGVFFSPSLDYMGSPGKGTYFYKGEWMWLDNALMQSPSFDRRGWDWDSVEILTPPGLVDISGFPISFDKSTARGFSDHLPLKCVLKYY